MRLKKRYNDGGPVKKYADGTPDPLDHTSLQKGDQVSIKSGKITAKLKTGTDNTPVHNAQQAPKLQGTGVVGSLPGATQPVSRFEAQSQQPAAPAAAPVAGAPPATATPSAAPTAPTVPAAKATSLKYTMPNGQEIDVMSQPYASSIVRGRHTQELQDRFPRVAFENIKIRKGKIVPLWRLQQKESQSPASSPASSPVSVPANEGTVTPGTILAKMMKESDLQPLTFDKFTARFNPAKSSSSATTSSSGAAKESYSVATGSPDQQRFEQAMGRLQNYDGPHHPFALMRQYDMLDRNDPQYQQKRQGMEMKMKQQGYIPSGRSLFRPSLKNATPPKTTSKQTPWKKVGENKELAWWNQSGE